jgi:hypothetical protein
MENRHGQVLARCPLGARPDEANECLLTDTFLLIRQRSKLHQFRLDQIWRLTFEDRRWWLPIALGGMLAFFCLTALFKTYYPPLALMSGLVAGLLLMYYGYQGTRALVVHEHKQHTDIFLKTQTPQLEAFVAFTNQLLQPLPEVRAYYIPPAPDGPQGSWRCLRQSEWRTSAHQQAWVVDPLTVANELQWKMEGSTLKPFLMRPPLPEFILWEEDRSGKLGAEPL